MIIVFGWNSSFFTFEKEELDAFPPLFICNLSFHGFLMNRPARDKFFDSHNEIVTNIDNEVWIDKNLLLIQKFIVNVKPFTIVELKSFYEDLLHLGVFYAEEMLLPDKATLDQFDAAGLLDRTSFWANINTYSSFDKPAQKRVFGIKVFTDGALGSRTAAMAEPFLTGEKGVLLHTDQQLQDMIAKVAAVNKPISIHAVGDLATAQVINVIHKMASDNKTLPPVIRMEHCMFISLANAKKAKALGMVLSMQPNFNYDSLQYSDRLLPKYCLENNPFRKLIDQAGFIPGIDLIFGSDGMPHGIDYALKQSLFPPYDCQRLTLEEFSAGYCMKNMEHGHIDLAIDEENKTLSTEVKLKCTRK
ncbi:MAG: amidohydrolase family protein [Deltaproteobacteria bacterium]|nr:amidohydrolase family protein [Deltaproteobacteria bacterium]